MLAGAVLTYGGDIFLHLPNMGLYCGLVIKVKGPVLLKCPYAHRSAGYLVKLRILIQWVLVGV